MQSITLSPPYAEPDIHRSPQVLIEQGDWSVYTAKVTRQEVVRWLAAWIGGDEYQQRIDCGMAGGDLVCPVYVYPLAAGVAYRLLTSWGQLSERVVEVIEIVEQVQFRLTDTASTKYPARAIRSVEWTVACLDPDGEVIASPALIISGQELHSGQMVYGTATVAYECERHCYILNAPRRLTAVDSHYSAVLVAPVAGYEPARIVLTMPPGIEAFERDPDAKCGGGSSSGSAAWDANPDPPPDPQPANLITEVDYCDQTTIREWTE